MRTGANPLSPAYVGRDKRLYIKKTGAGAKGQSRARCPMTRRSWWTGWLGGDERFDLARRVPSVGNAFDSAAQPVVP